MRFKWLDGLSHDRALLQQIGEACHMQRIEQVDLQVESISDMISKEWHATHECDVRNVHRFAIVGVAAIAYGQGMVDRNA